jgi:periplasmic divalent cation tolerance protein
MAASPEEAERIAQVLLDGRLAACVQVEGPVRSRYWWQDGQEEATEWRCTAKTRIELVDRVVAVVRGVHSYETPEIVATPIVAGDPAYLAWVEAEAQPPG